MKESKKGWIIAAGRKSSARATRFVAHDIKNKFCELGFYEATVDRKNDECGLLQVFTGQRSKRDVARIIKKLEQKFPRFWFKPIQVEVWVTN